MLAFIVGRDISVTLRANSPFISFIASSLDISKSSEHFLHGRELATLVTQSGGLEV